MCKSSQQKAYWLCRWFKICSYFHVSLEQNFLQNLYVNFSDLAAISWQQEALTELTEPAKTAGLEDLQIPAVTLVAMTKSFY